MQVLTGHSETYSYSVSISSGDRQIDDRFPSVLNILLRNSLFNSLVS